MKEYTKAQRHALYKQMLKTSEKWATWNNAACSGFCAFLFMMREHDRRIPDIFGLPELMAQKPATNNAVWPYWWVPYRWQARRKALDRAIALSAPTSKKKAAKKKR